MYIYIDKRETQLVKIKKKILKILLMCSVGVVFFFFFLFFRSNLNFKLFIHDELFYSELGAYV
nr:hypothetical protein Itr_chr11CG12390 [Ipomoea trifida]